MSAENRDDEMLEAGFAALRAAAPDPRPAFIEGLMADALAEQPAPARASVRRPRRWLPFGWPGGAALTGAALGGLALGYLGLVPLDALYPDADTGLAGFDDPYAALLQETDT